MLYFNVQNDKTSKFKFSLLYSLDYCNYKKINILGEMN